ncbi:MAG: hypothetical protein AAGK93_00725 [Pseudomonadota bacterium]
MVQTPEECTGKMPQMPGKSMSGPRNTKRKQKQAASKDGLFD